MSDMKCPICRTGNIKKYADGQHYACDNEDCPSYDETDERTFDILITTRKALDVAVDALKSAKTRMELINNSKFANLNHVLQIQCQCEVLKIDKALEQIKDKE